MKTLGFALLLVFGVSAKAEVSDIYRIDNNVYCGKQPKEPEFAELAHKGIKTVLDLRGGIIHKPHEKKLVESAGLQYVGIRLSGLFPPKREQMTQILALLEDPTRGPVFVHCRRGADRVGMVVACYRIAHDHWTNERALEEARERGISPLEFLMKRYIRKFDASKIMQGNSKGARLQSGIAHRAGMFAMFEDIRLTLSAGARLR